MSLSDLEISDYAGKRILVILLAGGVGDVLLSTVVLKPLKDFYKDSSITMMVRSGMEQLLDGNEYLTEILTVKDGDIKGKKFDYWLKRIREGQFDIAIVLWSRSHEAWLVYRAGIPVRVGQSSRLLYSFLYNHKVKVRSENFDTVTHWTEIMLDYVRALDVPVGKSEVRIDVPVDMIYEMKLLLNHHADDAGLHPPFWALHVTKGLNVDAGKWPVAFFAKLADSIVDELGGAVVFTGASGEENIVEAVRAKMNRKSISFVGKTTLKELAALAVCSRAFICPDSGPGHIAAVMGVPTISIFALKSDFPNRWKPFGPKVASVVPSENKCGLKCVKERCNTFECYNYIEIKQIVAKIVAMCSDIPVAESRKKEESK